MTVNEELDVALTAFDNETNVQINTYVLMRAESRDNVQLRYAMRRWAEAGIFNNILEKFYGKDCF